MGKGIAKVLLEYYKADGMKWLTNITVKAEEYKLNNS